MVLASREKFRKQKHYVSEQFDLGRSMPLIYKTRDPNYGLKKVLKRNVIRRKQLRASVLLETKQYIEAQHEMMSRGQVIDDAIRLYLVHRELSEVSLKQRESTKLESLDTTISQETLAYVQFMRGAMTPGELIDTAIMLHKKLASDTGREVSRCSSSYLS